MALEEIDLDVRAVVQMAWDSMPERDRVLLKTIGAAQWEVVGEPLGTAVDGYLRSAGHEGLQRAERYALDRALGVWIRELRIVLIFGGRSELEGLDARSREVYLSYVAWHEWAHALSIELCSADDVAAGGRLLERAPKGVRERIRRGGYSRKELTYEVIADVYALLMARRRANLKGLPSWLNDEIYEFVTRMTGWSG